MEDSTIQFKEQRSYRLIRSKFPPIDLYEDVADPEQLEAVFAVEALTNPRIMDAVGDVRKVPVKDRLVGISNASFVMGAFCHVSPDGARFNTGDFGAYYCAPDIETSIKETKYHAERVNGYTNEPAQNIDMRTIVGVFSGDLVDLTIDKYRCSDIYHETDYSASKAKAESLKKEDVDGVYYSSVRHESHVCYAIYKPNLFSRVTQGKHFEYRWNGREIEAIMEKKLVWEN